MDAIFIVLIVGFLAISAALVAGLDRLGGRK
jgi:hypothetical protein